MVIGIGKITEWYGTMDSSGASWLLLFTLGVSADLKCEWGDAQVFWLSNYREWIVRDEGLWIPMRGGQVHGGLLVWQTLVTGAICTNIFIWETKLYLQTRGVRWLQNDRGQRARTASFPHYQIQNLRALESETLFPAKTSRKCSNNGCVSRTCQNMDDIIRNILLYVSTTYV